MADQTKIQQEKFRVSVEDGKYIYVFYKDGGSELLRNGERWISTTGDKAMYAFASRVFDLEQFIHNVDERLGRVEDGTTGVLSSALEMAQCAEINLNNLADMIPGLRETPFFQIVALQLKETITHLGGKSV
jgi:hypothetical protein